MDKYIYLKRKNDYMLLSKSGRQNRWRIEKDTFLRLRSVLMGYFDEKPSLDLSFVDKISYVEIESKDLVVILFLFGKFIPDKETLLLANAFPQRLFLPWRNKFTLHLYIDSLDNGICAVSVSMQAKMVYN